MESRLECIVQYINTGDDRWDDHHSIALDEIVSKFRGLHLSLSGGSDYLNDVTGFVMYEWLGFSSYDKMIEFVLSLPANIYVSGVLRREEYDLSQWMSVEMRFDYCVVG